MKIRNLFFSVICLNFYWVTNAQTFINTESGLLFTGLNDIRYGYNGTLFSLKNDFSAPSIPFLRIRAGILLYEKHHFSILYAPLKISVKETLNKPIFYDGKVFEGNLPLEVTYKFNSYRLTYNRRLINKNNFLLGIGVSAKIRDAGISLENNEMLSRDSGVGFVPLLNMLIDWNISQNTLVSFFGEGLVGSKGRALDLSLSGQYNFNDNLHGKMGYRLLDGGVNGVERYNFVQFHFVFVSLNFSFHRKVKDEMLN